MNHLHILLFLCYCLCYLAPFVKSCKYENFSLVSYNIHGLPMIMTFDETYIRMKEISQLLHGKGFNVINFQEDWTKPGNNILINVYQEIITWRHSK